MNRQAKFIFHCQLVFELGRLTEHILEGEERPLLPFLGIRRDDIKPVSLLVFILEISDKLSTPRC